MPINPDAVGNTSEPSELSWTSKDSLLYALGVGAGVTDPTGFELEFTTENTKDTAQKALPTQVVVMGTGGGLDFGDFNLAALLHGEQFIQIHQTVQADGTAVGQGRVAEILDKGKAALVRLETTVSDTDGNPLWTSRNGLFISGEGGWGGDRGEASSWALPERDADQVISYTTRDDQALLYRLNGDRNPLHSDPSFAGMAGFDKPILHGLCTFGFTGRALLHGLCDSDPDAFGSMGGRFKSPVMPGEQLDVHMWNDTGADGTAQTLFQTRVGDRVVFDAGVFTNR
jgi:acyl dehydratase